MLGLEDKSDSDDATSDTEISEPVAEEEISAPVADDGEYTSDEDISVDIVLTGTNYRESSLTFSITSSPTNGEITGNVPNITYTPSSDYHGTDSFSFSVNDGVNDSESAATITITISSVNDDPSISGTPTTTVDSDSEYSFTPTSEDVDDDTLTFSVQNKPSWASFNTSTGKLSGTPTESDAGTHSDIEISVSDGTVSASLSSFAITVTDVTPPNMVSSLAATKADNGVISLSWSNPTVDFSGVKIMMKTDSYPSSTSDGTEIYTGTGTSCTYSDSAFSSAETTYYFTVFSYDDVPNYSLGEDTSISGYYDSLYEYQWYLKNTGQTAFSDIAGTSGEDLNLNQTILDGYTGENVLVAVVDSGLEIAHEDLVDNVTTGGSWDFVNSDTDPTNTADTDGDHGTSVAGLIAARGWNSIGGRGVSPAASLKGFNFLENQSIVNQVSALGGSSSSPNSSDVDIFNQSSGTSNTDDFLIDSALEAQLIDGVTNLRSGKGAIYIKSAGNGFESFGSATCTSANSAGLSCQNSNMDPSNAVPWNIIVGALNAEGKHSSYSTAGSSIWISAPGGESGYAQSMGWSSSNPEHIFKPAMVTTDQSGCDEGYSRDPYGATAPNPFENNLNGLNNGCNYTSTFNGTSSAAPVLSGAVALILEANPDLTWRDVRHILANTATQVDDSNTGTYLGSYLVELPWITNDAGYKFHNYYGFGRINVDSAIAMASDYSVNLGTFTDTGWNASGTISQAIPDVSSVGTSHTISVAQNLTIEAVQIKVDISHNWCGDLGIELTSPAGTESILFTIFNGFYSSADLSNMILLSNAFYGESSLGDWTIKVIDGESGITGIVNSWEVLVYGH